MENTAQATEAGALFPARNDSLCVEIRELTDAADAIGGAVS